MSLSRRICTSEYPAPIFLNKNWIFFLRILKNGMKWRFFQTQSQLSFVSRRRGGITCQRYNKFRILIIFGAESVFKEVFLVVLGAIFQLRGIVAVETGAAEEHVRAVEGLEHCLHRHVLD